MYCNTRVRIPKGRAGFMLTKEKKRKCKYKSDMICRKKYILLSLIISYSSLEIRIVRFHEAVNIH